MRTILRLVLATAAFGLAGAAVADEIAPPKQGEPAASAPRGPAMSPWYRDRPPDEPCWGDSSEEDADLNEGNRITVDEILRIINPVQS